MDLNFSVFETAIGAGAIAWGGRGIVGIQLPEADERALRARITRRYRSAVEAAPTADVERAIGAIQALLRGERVDLGAVKLDMRGVDAFDQQVYAIARRVPPGETISYGEIATRLGDVHLAREVGRALAHNPFPIVVPCHRVLGAGGKLGGFSAPGGVATKQRLLEIECASASWQLPLV